MSGLFGFVLGNVSGYRGAQYLVADDLGLGCGLFGVGEGDRDLEGEEEFGLVLRLKETE